MNEVGSWCRRDFLLRGRHILIEEQGGLWLLEEEAYCWKWRLGHGRWMWYQEEKSGCWRSSDSHAPSAFIGISSESYIWHEAYFWLMNSTHDPNGFFSWLMSVKGWSDQKNGSTKMSKAPQKLGSFGIFFLGWCLARDEMTRKISVKQMTKAPKNIREFRNFLAFTIASDFSTNLSKGNI